MNNYSTSKQESIDPTTERGCMLAILAKNWIEICYWVLTIVCATYILCHEPGALVSTGWIVGCIWATVSLFLAIALSVRSDENRWLRKLINEHTENERFLEAQMGECRKILEVASGHKSQTVQEPSA